MTDSLLPATSGSAATPPASGFPSSGRDHQAKFVRLLHDQILKLDQAELDFGLYRILNRRRADIRHYLDNELPGILRQAVGGAVEKRGKELETQLQDLTRTLNASAIGMGYESGAFENGELLPDLARGPNAQKYRQLRQQQAHLQAQQSLGGSEMDQLYLHLLTFFERYYQGGDFLPVPRRGRARYLAPYGGQDTLFHWRSRGSHYVKTSTELRTYAYTPANAGASGPKTIRFELKDADTEQNNVKGARRYFIPHPGEARLEGDALTVPFSYRPLTPAEETKYATKGRKAEADEEGEGDTETVGTIQERLLQDHLNGHSPEGVDAGELLKQARRYARKNTTDYFVHPNLGPFLKAELDTYLVGEYLKPESLQSPEVMQDRFAKYRALREAAGGLIDFLHQLEDFQAQLFEKRKFVLRADYLLPVRLAPEALWPTLLQSEAQLAAWRDLFHLDLTGQGPEDRLAALREHPTLVIDTRHHPAGIKFQLLAAFGDIEASLDGVLVHSENYGALRTLERTYRERVKLIYIDPPYNTGKDGFLYKDEFSRHSTWLSMLEERLWNSKIMLSSESAIFVSVDANELSNLRPLLDTTFGEANRLGDIVWKGATDNNPTRISIEHEYILSYAEDASRNPPVWESSEEFAKEAILSEYESLKDKHGNDIDAIQKSLRLFIRNNKESLNPLTHYDRVDNDGPYTGSRKVHNPGKEGYRYNILHPNGKITPQPARGYRFPEPTYKILKSQDKILFGEDETQIIQIKEYLASYVGSLKGVVELDGRVGANIIEGLFGSREVFKNPKPVELISKLASFTTKNGDILLDYFAGSGTTGHATIDLTRSDKLRRRFILMDMGEYFETIMLPRIEKVMYSPSWRAGKPNPMPRFTSLLGDLPDWVERSPRLVQVLRLESFEDSLDALELPHERTEREGQLTNLFGSQYLLKYMLGDLTEGQAVRVVTEKFQNPWAYHLRAGQTVDLPETFNLLLGLKVNQVRELMHGGRRYLLVRGVQHGTGERMLVVWRDVEELDPAAERDWLTAELGGLGWAWEDFDRVYVNADSALPRAESLDSEFKRLMLVRDEAFRALTAGGVA